MQHRNPMRSARSGVTPDGQPIGEVTNSLQPSSAAPASAANQDLAVAFSCVPLRVGIGDPLRNSICRLILAAEELTSGFLIERDSWYGPAFRYCSRCSRAGLHGAEIEHAHSCVVGQVIHAANLLRDEMAEVKDTALVSHADIDGRETKRKFAVALVAPFKDETESNCFLGDPVRKIVYDVARVDVGNGLDETAVTHEEAAAAHAGVFGEAAE